MKKKGDNEKNDEEKEESDFVFSSLHFVCLKQSTLQCVIHIYIILCINQYFTFLKKSLNVMTKKCKQKQKQKNETIKQIKKPHLKETIKKKTTTFCLPDS